MAATEHVWALHDALGVGYCAGLLLAAFAGLRLGEVCGLRVADVDFMRGIVSPALQYPADELKTEISRTPIPIPESLALTLSAHVAAYSASGWLLTNEAGGQLGPWQLQRAFRAARAKVDGLPAGFRFPRPAPLLRLAVDQLGRRRQGGPDPDAACVGQGHDRRLRPPLA